MAVVVITPPTAIVSLAQAKEHLKVEASEEDALIEAYIAAAESHIAGPGGWLGRSLGIQELELVANAFGSNGCALQLPCPPIVEVLSVAYTDPDGAGQILDPGEYVLTSCGGLLPAPGASWPATQNFPDAVRVRYRAGYLQPPKPVVAAILLMVGDLYRYRASVSDSADRSVPMSTTVENLLAALRCWSF